MIPVFAEVYHVLHLSVLSYHTSSLFSVHIITLHHMSQLFTFHGASYSILHIYIHVYVLEDFMEVKLVINVSELGRQPFIWNNYPVLSFFWCHSLSLIIKISPRYSELLMFNDSFLEKRGPEKKNIKFAQVLNRIVAMIWTCNCAKTGQMKRNLRTRMHHNRAAPDCSKLLTFITRGTYLQGHY